MVIQVEELSGWVSLMIARKHLVLLFRVERQDRWERQYLFVPVVDGIVDLDDVVADAGTVDPAGVAGIPAAADTAADTVAEVDEVDIVDEVAEEESEEETIDSVVVQLVVVEGHFRSTSPVQHKPG